MHYFIGENKFRVFLPDVQFIEKSEDAYNSRQLFGVMSTQRLDRQGESVISKGLDFADFMNHGHFNDNHSQETSAVVGYPEEIAYHKDLAKFNPELEGVEGWTCRGYVLKGTKRSDGIWELAKALADTPHRRLGFSIEGKVERRVNKTIKSAKIRNLAITNSPVNTDAQWNILAKSFHDEDTAVKALSAGVATSPASQSGGSALRAESLDSDEKDIQRKKREKILRSALGFNDLVKAMDYILEKRPDFDEEAAAYLTAHLFKKGGKL